MINSKQQLIAEICHIEAAAPNGPRYNAAMTPEARRSATNLLILCHAHHVETHGTEFTVEDLRAMKQAHEALAPGAPFDPPAEVVGRIAAALDAHWSSVEAAAAAHPVPDFAVPVPRIGHPLEALQAVHELLDGLERLHGWWAEIDEELPKAVAAFLEARALPVPSRSDLFGAFGLHRAFEVVSLGIPNTMTRLHGAMLQLEVFLLTQQVALHPADERSRSRLEQARDELVQFAGSAGLAD